MVPFVEHNGEAQTTVGNSARLLHNTQHMMQKNVQYVHRKNT